MDQDQEKVSLLLKISLYLFGVTLGIGAKLATIYSKRMITKKDIVVNAMLAYSAAWFVLAILYYYKVSLFWMLAAAVVVGRDGDSIILAAISFCRKYLSKYFIELGEKLQQKDEHH